MHGPRAIVIMRYPPDESREHFVSRLLCVECSEPAHAWFLHPGETGQQLLSRAETDVERLALNRVLVLRCVAAPLTAPHAIAIED